MTPVPGFQHLMWVKSVDSVVEDEWSGRTPEDLDGDYDEGHHNFHWEDTGTDEDEHEDGADAEGTDDGFDNSNRAADPSAGAEVADGDGGVDGVDMDTSVAADCRDISGSKEQREGPVVVVGVLSEVCLLCIAAACFCRWCCCRSSPECHPIARRTWNPCWG